MGRNKPVYLSVLTNGYTKILRFDNNPPATQPAQNSEETKNELLSKATQFVANIAMVNISIIQPGCELMSLYLKGITAKLAKTKTNLKLEFSLQNI